MKIIDIIILLISVSIVLLVSYRSHKKAKIKKANGSICGGSCAGCSGCSSIEQYFKEIKAQD